MKLTFVHLVESMQWETGTARLASQVRAAGAPWQAPELVFAGWGEAETSILARIRNTGPSVIALRVAHETAEVVTHMAERLAEHLPGVAIVFHGPLCQDDPDRVVPSAPRSVILAGEAESILPGLLDRWSAAGLPTEPVPGSIIVRDGVAERGESVPLGDPRDWPFPDDAIFGGPDLMRRGVGSSLFGELGVLPVELGVGTPSGSGPGAGIAAFAYATDEKPRSAEPVALARRVCEVESERGELAHVEVRDRELGWDFEPARELVERLQGPDGLRRATYSIRFLPETSDRRILDVLDPAVARRVVLECDAVTRDQYLRVPGLQNPDRVVQTIRDVEARGLDVALLVTVGIPFESSADIDLKIELIRSSPVRRVRFVPFEPRRGHPIFELCERNEMLPQGEARWNREVYAPLVQPSLDTEEWHGAWQRCLDLEAELALRQPTDFSQRRA